ncbi:acetyl-CoA carboxylase biotin carboxyl carrier protein [Lachnospiraceae bacterium]|jgi:acetyl-CoA carboxylase biotin carboxyl carrier protein|nr:acetyl-CoA carboxylase biotin carboxyl carrier protein [uncultured Schaedlerella sp.]EOS39291.1 acetyl-CoA carboxylase, biotin carboxyl carrier protein [Lachnospiraceae bacterium M18-1]MCI9153401.1 acetyl-CoA carboxylase biotin carboxyl carrier protein [Ruminococcus sp.]NBI58191.1 acetyl-CoA carboxylase biotin carboxyl carrier protein [Lachnospiraceae bacterium]
MKFEQVLQLVDAVSVSSLTEFKYEEGGVKISMKKAPEGTAEPVSVLSHSLEPAVTTEPETAGIQAATAVKEAAPAGEEKEEEGGQVITSPLVGTFYAAPAEDAKPYVQVGDQVKKGQVLAIVEAMKLMNEIESDFSGEVVKILAENGKAVEYGQPLFIIK